MDHVILDTNIFIKENFLHGKKINSLLNLSEKKKIQLYITEITYNELKANFAKFATNGISNHNKFVKDFDNWVLQNDNNLLALFEKINTQKVVDAFNLKLDALIENKIIKIIPYSSINIQLVFDKYFKSVAPFGNGDKKSEFPDAFTLELIKDYCDSNEIKATVFSTDKDLLNSKFDDLKISDDYKGYLERVYSDMETVKKQITDTLFNSNTKELKQQFFNWYEEYLNDESLYDDIVRWKEIYDVDIIEINIGELDYKIIEIKNDTVVIEVETTVNVKVNVLTDDEEYMYYDSDDRSHHFARKTTETVEKEFSSSMIAYIEIFDEDDYFDDFVVESINEGKEIYFDTGYEY